jgi:hypothetical protein
MRSLGIVLTSALLVASLPGAAAAQSSWPSDPFSELVASFAPAESLPENLYRVPVRHRTTRPLRRRVTEREHRTVDRGGRLIRAHATVTIVDRDHVVIELTRRGIGEFNGPTASAR